MTMLCRVLNRKHRNEHGAILVMAVPGVLLAVVAMSLSVDIGRQAFEKRNDQSIADLAALDSVRSLATIPPPSDPSSAIQAAAEKSAARNGLDLGAAGSSVTTELGWVDPSRVFHPADANVVALVVRTGAQGPFQLPVVLVGALELEAAVRVRITSAMEYIFQPGEKSLTAVAVARIKGGLVTTTSTTVPPTSVPPPTTTTTTTGPTPFTPKAGFTLGSTLASIDTTKASLLDAVLGAMLGGSADLVGWQGLVASELTLEALGGQLELLHAGVQFGTVDQMLDADITLADLATATSAALSASGDTNAALYTGPLGIIAQSKNTATFKLGQVFTVAAGVKLATEFNALQLLTGSAMVANGTNLISVPNIGLSLPGGIGTTGLTLKVIEGQKIYIGPAASAANPATVSTGQIDLTLTSALDIPISVPDLSGARLTGTLPLSLTAAGATGTLQSIVCPPASGPGGSIGVGVDLKTFAAATSSVLEVSAGVLGPPVPLFSVTTSGTVQSTDPPPTNLAFTYPGEFSPSATGKRVGSAPLGLSSLTTMSATATTLGAVPVPAGLGSAVASAVLTVLGSLDLGVISPLLGTLGVSVGVADVSALNDALVKGCAAPVPSVVTTTATTAAPAPPVTTTTTAPSTSTSSIPVRNRPELVG